MSKLNGLFGVIDFFVPLEVLSSVFLVFVAENILEQVVGDLGLYGWLAVYGIGLAVVSVMRYVGADEDERAELSDDFDQLES